MKNIAIFILVSFLTTFSYSQNCDSTSESSTYAATNNGYEEIANTILAPGQYVTITNILSNEYTFTSSLLESNDFITIRNSSGDTVIQEGNSPLIYTFQPSDIPNGTIRVIVHLDNTCDSTDDGNHTVTLLNKTNLPTCYEPQNPKVSYLSNTRLDFSWDAPSSGTTPLDYEWEIGLPNFLPGTGADVVKGSTGGVKNVSSGETLNPNTAYEVAIRSNCGSGDFSIWYKTPSITTLSADPPSNDFCNGAISILEETGKNNASLASAIVGSILGGAGTDFNAETCNGKTANARDDVWYSFLAQTTDVNITLEPSFDGRLTLFSGNCSSLTNIACSDTNVDLNPRGEQITYNNLVIGQTYYFRVYYQGFSTSSPDFIVKLWSPTVTTDADGDGYSANPAVDCNDGNASINPGATEICDGLDNNCDGQVDEGLAIVDYYPDMDGDGFGDSSASPISVCSALQPADTVTNNTDCDDTDLAVKPSGIEILDNGKDDDCDPLTLDSSADIDDDSDGFTENQGDCDDTKNNIYPGAPEVPDNNIDEDCDGADIKTWYLDADADNFGNINEITLANIKPMGYVSNNTDCNDGDNTIYPGATELVANSIDENCDGQFLWYQDNDLDGYGSLTVIQSNNSTPGSGESNNAADCNDGNAAINPDAIDIVANGIDENCDGLFQWYQDNDLDGYGSLLVIQSSNSSPQSGESNNSADCNDSNLAINPDATDIVANGIDENCDGLFLWYEDNDLDGYGSTMVVQSVNTSPQSGESNNNTDCNDGNASINPGVAEILNNGADDDCNPATGDTLGIEEFNFESVIIQPNPFNDRISIQLNANFTNDIFNINFMDLNGRNIFNYSKISTAQGIIILDHLNGLQQGIYLIKISNQNKSVIKKIIKI